MIIYSRILGIVFIIVGLLFFLTPPLTGFTIFSSSSTLMFAPIGIISITFGIFIIFMSLINRLNDYEILEERVSKERLEGLPTDLVKRAANAYRRKLKRIDREEKYHSKHESKYTASKLRIIISEPALERARKEHFIREHIPQYLSEIQRIASNPEHRPHEKIGEFKVSPKGRSPGGIRVAWHMENGVLYIDDFRYHIKEHEYDEKWNRKATDGIITRGTYAQRGYKEFSGNLSRR